MEALVVSTAFGMGLLLVFEGLVRPAERSMRPGRLRSLGPPTAAGFAGAVAGFTATGWPAAAIAGAAVGWAAPGALGRSRAERVRLARREAIAEVSSRLRDAIRSGIGISDALAHVAERAPSAVAGELRRLVSEAQVSGLAPAATGFAARLADPSAELLASALSTADRLGSTNLSDVLDSLAEATAAQAGAVREAKARQTRNRTSARIVAAVPVLLLLAIRWANPAYLEPFSEPAGQVVLGFALGLIGLGYAAMRRASRIEGVPR